LDWIDADAAPNPTVANAQIELATKRYDEVEVK